MYATLTVVVLISPTNFYRSKFFKATLCTSRSIVVLSTGEDCVRSCTGVEDGDHQNCRECDIYVKCAGGKLTEASCGNGQTWDSTVNTCKTNPAGVCKLELVDPPNGGGDDNACTVTGASILMSLGGSFC